MSKHTPGPWGYTYDGSSQWSIGPAEDPQGDDCVASIWDRNDERARANARLIAAAPALLAAAQQFAFWAKKLRIDQLFPDFLTGSELSLFHQDVDFARATIAKATGSAAAAQPGSET